MPPLTKSEIDREFDKKFEECNGYLCEHETSEKHYVIWDENIKTHLHSLHSKTIDSIIEMVRGKITEDSWCKNNGHKVKDGWCSNCYSSESMDEKKEGSNQNCYDIISELEKMKWDECPTCGCESGHECRECEIEITKTKCSDHNGLCSYCEWLMDR